MTFPKKKQDWSKPPQGGIERKGWATHRSEPKLFWGLTNFLLLTVGIGFVSARFASHSAYPIEAIFYFVIGLVVIPLVALVQVRRYGKMFAAILRGVNNYMLVTYAVRAVLYGLTLYIVSMDGLLVLAPVIFVLGYFLAITTSATLAMERKPTPVVAPVNPNLENLSGFKPSDDERV